MAAFNLNSLKSQFALKTTTVNLGHASRQGGESAAKMAQIGIDGNPLTHVSEQKNIIEFEGGNAKMRCFFAEGVGRGFSIINEPTGKTTTVYLPLPTKKIEDFKTPVDKFPTSAVAKGNGKDLPDFELVKMDEEGNIVAKAEEVNGNWYLAKYNQPTYKQKYNNYGEPITAKTSRGEDRTGVLVDADGSFYIEIPQEATHVALNSITVVPGFAVSASGSKINGTDGLYVIYGDNSDSRFSKINATASAGKFSIRSLTKVLTHPSFGIAAASDTSEAGVLKQGKCSIDTKGVKIKVYNSKGEIDEAYSKEINDREGYRLGKFTSKGQRAVTLEDTVSTEGKAAKQEVLKAVAGTASVEDIF
jgi:hypothetical protein